MKGIVFNLLERAVGEHFGESTWEMLLDKASLDGAYTSLGSYPDEHLYRLVGAASEALQLPPDAVVQWFGKACIPLMFERFPEFFRPHTNTRSLLLRLNDVIHPEVRKAFPGAEAPSFRYDTSSSEVLVMHYQSSRKLCSFALGLIEGAAAHYEEEVSYEHSICMKNGASVCTFQLVFKAAAGETVRAA